jgi:hypothetical protein
MAGTGTATVSFGAAPGGNTASVVITGQAAILAGSLIESWLMYSTSADHNETEHLVVPMQLRCGTIVPGTGFTIYAMSEWVLTGAWTLQWVWS